jgi:hypothetical protein
MPRVRASILLRHWLKLGDGKYPTGRPGRELDLETVWPRTRVSITDDQPDTSDRQEQYKLNDRQAKLLLDLTNRLLRCYRAITRNATITELSLAAASPFSFSVITGEADVSAWPAGITYKTTVPKAVAQRIFTLTSKVRALLLSGQEPEVAVLFLLDAEQALHEGRFREAVLFCWSTIDSTFSRKYDALVDSKLEDEWSEARDFFKGVEFGLRKKMSAALYLISGRSLFRESGDLWQELSISYNKRNGIIHRGENADEDDARRALSVARSVVGIMDGL